MFENLVNIYDDFTKNERTQSLQRIAIEYGFEFEKRASFGTQSLDIRDFKIFKPKGTKRFLGILSQELRSKRGEIRFYDYLKTADLETTTTSIIEIRSDDHFFDPIRIAPKKKVPSIGRLFKKKKSDPLASFREVFKVISDYPEDINKLGEEALLNLLRYPKMTVEIVGNYFLFYFKNKEMKLTATLDYMDFAEEFLELSQDINSKNQFV